jgi:hypothetical protein
MSNYPLQLLSQEDIQSIFSPFHSPEPTPLPLTAFAADTRTMAGKLPPPAHSLLRKLALHITEQTQGTQPTRPNARKRCAPNGLPLAGYLQARCKFFEQRWRAFLVFQFALEAALARVFLPEAWAALTATRRTPAGCDT